MAGFDVWDSALALDVDPRQAYVSLRSGGLRVLQVADPLAPVAPGTYTPAGAVRAIRVDGDRAYLASASGLQIADVSAPGAPRLLGRLAPATPLEGLEVAGGRAYVVEEQGGVSIVDVTDASAPQRLGG